MIIYLDIIHGFLSPDRRNQWVWPPLVCLGLRVPPSAMAFTTQFLLLKISYYAITSIYPLAISHSHGKSLIKGGFNGKSSINGPFSMAMLNNQSKIH